MSKSSPFCYTHNIAFHETDMAGIVHFSQYFKYMEITEHAFFKYLNIPLITKSQDCTYGWPRTRANCKYIKPLRFQDTINIFLYIEDLLSECIRYQFIFFKGAEKAAIGQMSTIFASFNIYNNELSRAHMQESFISALKAYKMESSLSTKWATI